MLLCLPAGSPIAFNQVGFVARLVRMYGGPGDIRVATSPYRSSGRFQEGS